MSRLADFDLLLPYTAWKNIDWKERIHAETGLMRRILQMQERAAHAIAGINPSPVTPEKLAWTTLWARISVLLHAVYELYHSDAVRVATVLDRAALELYLQIDAIRLPWEVLNAARQQLNRRIQVTEEALNAAWPDVTDRLRGYAAWALTNDLLYYRKRIRSSELSRIHQATSPATLPKTTDEEALLRYFFGEVEIVSVAEAEQDRKRQKRHHTETIDRLEGWLANASFGHWTSNELAPWISGREQRTPPPTLFGMFDANTPTLGRYLDQRDLPEFRVLYDRCSMALHSSSIMHCVLIDRQSAPGQILPLVLAADGDRDSLCQLLAGMCNVAIGGLWGMRDYCIT